MFSSSSFCSFLRPYSYHWASGSLGSLQILNSMTVEEIKLYIGVKGKIKVYMTGSHLPQKTNIDYGPIVTMEYFNKEQSNF